MTETRSSHGTGTLGLLGVAFIVMKLCGVIDWSWWWVLAPFWGRIAIFLGVCTGFFVLMWLGERRRANR